MRVGAAGRAQGFSPPPGNVQEFRYFSWTMALAIGHMAMLHINRESDAFENPMLRNLYKESRSLHCIAVTESLSYCVHHYSRSTSAGIFMARLHTTAIFCSCQFLIFDSRPIYTVYFQLQLSHFLVDFYNFCTIRNRNEYFTTIFYLLR